MSGMITRDIEEALRSADNQEAAKVCRKDAHRASELADLIFTTERETMYVHVLVYTDNRDGERRLAMDQISRAAQPFCDDGIPEEIKLQALHLDYCTHALILNTGLLAFLKEGNVCGFRIRECHMHVKPTIKVSHFQENGKLIDNGQRLHSFFLLRPWCLPRETTKPDPCDLGYILDSSAAQMGYQETISCAATYVGSKYNEDSPAGKASAPLGECALRRMGEMDEKSIFELDAVLSVIYNILFDEMNSMGGVEPTMDLSDDEWNKFVLSFRGKLQAGLGKLRKELDSIRFLSGGKGKEEIEEMKTKLMERCKGTGYKHIMGLVYSRDVTAGMEETEK